MDSILWKKLLEEFNDSSRWSLEQEPVMGYDNILADTVCKARHIVITWKPSEVCYQHLLLQSLYRYPQKKWPEILAKKKGKKGEEVVWNIYLGKPRLLKIITRGFSKTKQYNEPTSSKNHVRQWKVKTRGYGSIWKQKCYFNHENHTICIDATVPVKRLGFWKVNRDNTGILTSQKIKISLTLPIWPNNPAMPKIKPANKRWKTKALNRNQYLDGDHAPGGGGPIKFVTYFWCKIAQKAGRLPIMYDFKSAMQKDIHHKGWETKDYRIGHNKSSRKKIG